MTLKCFLAWRAIARYEQSELTCSQYQQQNKLGSDLEAVQSYEMTPSLANTHSVNDDAYGSMRDSKMQKVNDIMQRYSNFQSLNSSQDAKSPLSQPQSEIHQINR